MNKLFLSLMLLPSLLWAAQNPYERNRFTTNTDPNVVSVAANTLAGTNKWAGTNILSAQAITDLEARFGGGGAMDYGVTNTLLTSSNTWTGPNIFGGSTNRAYGYWEFYGNVSFLGGTGMFFTNFGVENMYIDNLTGPVWNDIYSAAAGMTTALLTNGVDASAASNLNASALASGTVADARLSKAATNDLNKTTMAVWGDSLGSQLSSSILPNAVGTNFSVLSRSMGGYTSTQILSMMGNATNGMSRKWSQVIWAGANDTVDLATNWTNTFANISNCVYLVGTNPNYLVLGTLGNTNAYTNTAYWANLTTLNSNLATAYPSNFYDIRTYLITQTNGTAQDTTDQSMDLIPTSLRADFIHLNDAGYTLVANKIRLFFQTNLVISTLPISAAQLGQIFAYPPPIGQMEGIQLAIPGKSDFGGTIATHGSMFADALGYWSAGLASSLYKPRSAGGSLLFDNYSGNTLLSILDGGQTTLAVTNPVTTNLFQITSNSVPLLTLATNGSLTIGDANNAGVSTTTILGGQSQSTAQIFAVKLYNNTTVFDANYDVIRSTVGMRFPAANGPQWGTTTAFSSTDLWLSRSASNTLSINTLTGTSRGTLTLSNLTASGTITTTNGYVLIDNTAIPTNSIPPGSTTVTNWWFGTYLGVPTFIATNHNGTAGWLIKALYP